MVKKNKRKPKGNAPAGVEPVGAALRRGGGVAGGGDRPVGTSAEYSSLRLLPFFKSLCL